MSEPPLPSAGPKPATFNEDDAPPPSYTESQTQSLSSPLPSPVLPLTPTSPLAAHLAALPSRMRAAQAAHQTSRAAHDAHLVSLLLPHLQRFLEHVARAGVLPAELALVPARAVAPGWTPAWEGAGRVARVDDDGDDPVVAAEGPSGKGEEDKGGDEKKKKEEEERGEGRRGPALRGFSDWGRYDDDDDENENATSCADGRGGDAGRWWFVDEAQARRLAAYLHPQTQPALVERRAVQAAVEKAREDKKKSWWGRKSVRRTSDAGPVSPRAGPAAVPETPGTTTTAMVADDGIILTVRADEVTFRRENEFGVFESLSGWGIVATVRRRRG